MGGAKIPQKVPTSIAWDTRFLDSQIPYARSPYLGLWVPAYAKKFNRFHNGAPGQEPHVTIQYEYKVYTCSPAA